MTDKTSLGDRMKRYEAATHQVLPPRSYSIVRVDVRAAHTLLKDADKPFDKYFVDDMNNVAETLCKEIQGAQFAYTQSDEVSVLFIDFQNLESQPWFGGVVSKQVSIAASLASVTLADWGWNNALFDARVFTLPDAVEVANYFVWRQKDAIRNSINMVARAHMSHRECHGKNTDQLVKELDEKHGVKYWADIDEGLKRGRITARYDGGWLTAPAPGFKAESSGWLDMNIPEKPSFGCCEFCE